MEGEVHACLSQHAAAKAAARELLSAGRLDDAAAEERKGGECLLEARSLERALQEAREHCESTKEEANAAAAELVKAESQSLLLDSVRRQMHGAMQATRVSALWNRKAVEANAQSKALENEARLRCEAAEASKRSKEAALKRVVCAQASGDEEAAFMAGMEADAQQKVETVERNAAEHSQARAEALALEVEAAESTAADAAQEALVLQVRSLSAPPLND